MNSPDLRSDQAEPTDSAAPDISRASTVSRKPLRLLLLALMALSFISFLSLGTWQIRRLQWKLDLIERVEQRVHASPSPAPDCRQTVNAQSDEYRHVIVAGKFLPHKNTLVQASTQFGRGFWVLSPLKTDNGCIVLINRGYIPEKMALQYQHEQHTQQTQQQHDDITPPSQVVGLLRISEPGGSLLQRNQVSANKWFSRDVTAIANSLSLSDTAPYFIDADASSLLTSDLQKQDSSSPVGGLTVVQFHNNHLVYAVVWYSLALMTAAAWLYIVRQGRRS
ncbi:SURF1 family protein [Undibacterium sp. SXout7W]|uniref:SURF1 family protein n=1 Tax=Undibacterium sp. SXout7W TaxID=3413049 RepID=UPI003BF338C5